jgi:hypothetical protein
MAKKREIAAQDSPMDMPRVAHFSEQGRDFRLRLPRDLSDEIEKESAVSGIPQNRIIINRLAAFGQNNKAASMDSLLNHLETLLARYGTRLNSVELAEDLARAANEVVNAKAAELPAKVDKLRVILRAMQEMERAAAVKR